MDRKKKTNAKELLEKQKIARRMRYAEIKEDPVLYELVKEKEKRRYQKRKDEKKIKSVSEESRRVQREKRKKWREASKKYRKNKKEESKNKPEVLEVLLIDAATDESDEIKTEDEDPFEFNESFEAGVTIQRIRYIEQKKRKLLIDMIKKLEEENNQLKLMLNMVGEKRQLQNKIKKYQQW